MQKKKFKKENLLIDKYCNHLESGLSQKSFPDEENEIIEKIAEEIDKYSKNNLLIKKIAKAKRKGMLFWEKVGIKGIQGNEKKFYGTSWMFVMKNLFGWKEKPVENQISNEEKIIEVNYDFGEGENNNSES